MLSATTEVSRVSMEPRQARVRAGITAAEIICPQFIPASDISGFAKNGSGRPLGIYLGNKL